MSVDYDQIIKECEARAEMYKSSDAVWNQTHEERCKIAITELLKRTEKAEKQRDKAVKTIETIMGCQKFCALCDNSKCKNSNTRDASCNPIWNGLEE